VSDATKLICGILLILLPTIEFGGTFLLRILSGNEQRFSDFQRAMFRAGHAHAGVLVVLALVAQILMDQARLPENLGWAVRIGFVLAALLVSGGFFGGAMGGIDKPGGLIALLWIGVFILAGSVITLGIGLLRARS
jgi:hypothetical protein